MANPTSGTGCLGVGRQDLDGSSSEVTEPAGSLLDVTDS